MVELRKNCQKLHCNTCYLMFNLWTENFYTFRAKAHYIYRLSTSVLTDCMHNFAHACSNSLLLGLKAYCRFSADYVHFVRPTNNALKANSYIFSRTIFSAHYNTHCHAPFIILINM